MTPLTYSEQRRLADKLQATFGKWSDKELELLERVYVDIPHTEFVGMILSAVRDARGTKTGEKRNG